jgi:hypothetical protein
MSELLKLTGLSNLHDISSLIYMSFFLPFSTTYTSHKKCKTANTYVVLINLTFPVLKMFRKQNIEGNQHILTVWTSYILPRK